MQEQLFEPLGMKSAGFGAPGKPGKPDQPWGHDNLLGIYSAVEPGPGADNPEVIAPAGCVHVSIGDWAKYVGLHLDAATGQSSLLSTDTWNRIHSDPFKQEYGFGWVFRDLEWLGGKVLLHDGSNRHWYAMAVIAPERNLSIVVATNAADSAAQEACAASLRLLSKVGDK